MRQRMAPVGPGSRAKAALESAASRAEAAISRFMRMRSGKLKRLAARAPITKPICTPLVSQAAAFSDSDQARFSSGAMAFAENQQEKESTTARHNSASIDQRPSAGVSRVVAVLIGLSSRAIS